MKLGNIGKLSVVNGTVHLELDAVIGGTPEVPLSADIEVVELLKLLQESAPSTSLKLTLGVVIQLFSLLNIQSAEV